MLKEIYPILANRFKSFCLSAGTEYIKEKYGYNSDICIAYSKEAGRISLQTREAFITVHSDKADSARANIGENTILRYGFNPSSPSVIVLIPTISLVKELGIIRAIKFLINWQGHSTVMEQVAVIYKIIGEKECPPSHYATGEPQQEH